MRKYDVLCWLCQRWFEPSVMKKVLVVGADDLGTPSTACPTCWRNVQRSGSLEVLLKGEAVTVWVLPRRVGRRAEHLRHLQR